jgi:hypothetical protein
VVIRLPPVPASDAGRFMGRDHGRIERERAGSRRPSDDRHRAGEQPPVQENRRGWSAPIIRRRAQKADSETGFRPLKSVRWENDPLDRFLNHLPLHDQDPPPRQRCRPAHEIGHHAGADIGLSGLRPGYGRQPARTGRSVADLGYGSDNVRKTIEARNVVPVIPMRKSRKLRVAVDRTLYRLRNLVQRCFNTLKNPVRHRPWTDGGSLPHRRHTRRQNRRKLSGLHRHHVDPPPAPPFVNMT